MQGFVRKPVFKRSLKIPRHIWENNIKVDGKDKTIEGLV